ncbi:hypothetical protein PGH42_18560 [Legionella pneumophila]|nr:hypothetical protein PGH42_18560 [Legionella pneumophila]
MQQICELHGGRVVLDSPKIGTGLIVRVYLPIKTKPK